MRNREAELQSCHRQSDQTGVGENKYEAPWRVEEMCCAYGNSVFRKGKKAEPRQSSEAFTNPLRIAALR
jgi:hypothetical protein